MRLNPVPQELSGRLQPFDKRGIRTWGDEPPEIFNQSIRSSRTSGKFQKFAEQIRQHPSFISISGGGADGAYGAGVIAGWTKSGHRPTFAIVTGVSTGALVAPFVFLGPDYDWALQEVYNTHGTADLVSVRALIPSLFSDAFFDSNPLKQRIAEYLTMDEMRAIAAEYEKGRLLLIGTTDMDALRPVIWDIGLIAQEDTPAALELIHRIILASASIPVAFPPVVIKVRRGDKVYQELHADGGVTNQVFLFPPGLNWQKFVEHFDIRSKPKLYIIRNDRMAAKFETTKARLRPLASRSIDSLIRTQGIGDLFRLYVTAVKNDFQYYLSHVPNDFHRETYELFDPDYMRLLFQIGYEQGKQGGCWFPVPPGMVEQAGQGKSTECRPPGGLKSE